VGHEQDVEQFSRQLAHNTCYQRVLAGTNQFEGRTAMKTILSYLNSMLGVAVLLLVASAGALAQEGYYGATQTMAFSAEPSLPVWFARS
jgi:hypothetical protein